MGNTWEVYSFLPCDSEDEGKHYEFELVWCGESRLRMMREARKAKKTSGCVKVMWRG